MSTPDEAAPLVNEIDTLPGRLDVLAGLSSRPLHEHADVYQVLHADLQAALAEIDSA
jgi:hypothetical protein